METDRTPEEQKTEYVKGVKNSVAIKIALLAFLLGIIVVLTAYVKPLPFDLKSASYPTNTITLTETGYKPKELVIPKGTTVHFKNETERPHWPASNLHPGHEIYPEFDPMAPVAAEETWSFTFDQVGHWRMHDHIRAYYTATIIVTPE